MDPSKITNLQTIRRMDDRTMVLNFEGKPLLVRAVSSIYWQEGMMKTHSRMEWKCWSEEDSRHYNPKSGAMPIHSRVRSMGGLVLVPHSLDDVDAGWVASPCDVITIGIPDAENIRAIKLSADTRIDFSIDNGVLSGNLKGTVHSILKCDLQV